MSSSRGAVPTPADALAIIEPAVLRWLYARRRPNQSFKVAFDQEIYRLYDEWDSLERRIAQDEAGAEEQVAHARSTQTALGEMPLTPRPFPYRTLASIVDITTGAEEQTLRIVHGLDTENPVTDLHELRPRLDCAERWSVTYMPADQHTDVRAEPDRHLLASLGEGARESLWLLSAHLTDDWSLDGLTSLVYGVPKLSAGLPLDAGPTQELKAAQREFFALLYRLLVGRDTGPRLPTLLLAVGPERVRALIDLAATA